jgi:signal transduction histidine kinase
MAVARVPAYRERGHRGRGPTASAVVCLPGHAAAAYSRPVGSLTGRARSWGRRVVIRHRGPAVLVGTAVLFGCAVTTALTHRPRPLPLARTEVTIAVVTYVVFAAIAVARRPSWLLVAASTAGAVASMAAGVSDNLIGAAQLMAILVFSLPRDLPRVIACTVAASAALAAGHLAFSLHSGTGLTDLEVVPWLAVVAAAGQAVRARRIQRTLLAERASHAEELREAEARRRIQERIQEERLRIARDLHDAVGHQVALISVQAGAMSFLLGNDQDKARESLAHIQRASEAALDELRLTVGLLRQPGDSEPTEPAAGLGRLGELIGSFTATGLTVTCEVSGQARALPEAIDLTAYRVIQESLTNSAKHAAGASATVRLAFREGVLALAIEDDGPSVADRDSNPPRGDGDPGHGLIGMRERTAAVGGWVSAGPRDGGGFQVLAELPIPVGTGS